MIQINNLYKSFEDKQVLKDISSVFENGKTNLIIGQSGSGKTVLMKCIVGLLTPESGSILYDGRDYVSMKKKEKKLLAQIKGIEVQYSTNPQFKQNPVTRKVGKSKTKIVPKLKKKTTYFVRVRYVGKDGYSKWTKAKKVKTK